jgi:hypothetical protein
MNVLIQLFVYDARLVKNEHDAMLKQNRLQEQAYCLLKNCYDPNIKSIHIFHDTPEAKEFYTNVSKFFPEKVVYVYHGKQPTYKELVQYASQTFQEGELVCIMNSDIFFNSSKDHELIRQIARPKRLISLTRHEFTNEGHSICTSETCNFTGNGGSSDVFIFQMPVPAEFPYDSVDHKQNLFGAESVFHKAWTDCGYDLVNPCDDIKTIHLHKGRIHFEAYKYVDTPENGVSNWKTRLEDALL